MGALDKVKELEEMKKQYQARLEKEAKAVVGEVFAEFFAANPTVKAVQWDQYTPYFNDGDVCEFGVNDFYFSLQTDAYAPEHGYPEEDENGEEGMRGSCYERSPEASAVKALRGVLPEDVLEVAFGDHKGIIATKDGFSVEDRDHD